MRPEKNTMFLSFCLCAIQNLINFKLLRSILGKYVCISVNVV